MIPTRVPDDPDASLTSQFKLYRGMWNIGLGIHPVQYGDFSHALLL
jgi:hypothetical protein